MNQSVVLNGNVPKVGSLGRWEIQSGIGGLISDISNPTATFIGVPGQSYGLQWVHYNECSTSSDQLTLTFSESAAGVPSANGRYYIPDPRFRAYLQLAYPTVMDGDSLIVANGILVDNVRITNLNVLNLDGLQFLTELVSFIANGDFQSIPYFSSKLTRFECACNQLEIIPAFPASLDIIVGWSWRISSMPDFPIGLRELNLGYINGITELPYLPDSCTKVFLTWLGTGCCPPELSRTVNIPAMAKNFDIQNINMPAFPTIPGDHTKLEYLRIEGTNLSDMPSFSDFTKLKEMYLANNSFLVLNYLPFALQQIRVGGNPLICVKNKPPLVESQLAEYPLCPDP